VEDISAPPDQSHPPARRRRRKRHHRDEIKKGNLSVIIQLGIIVVAVGIAGLVLLAFLGLIGQPSKPAPVDQAIIDSQ